MRTPFAIAVLSTLLVSLVVPAAEASEDPITGTCLRSEFRLPGGKALTVFVVAPFKARDPKGLDPTPTDSNSDVDVANMALPVVVICRTTEGQPVTISGVRYNETDSSYDDNDSAYMMYNMGIVGVKRANMKNCMPVKSPRIDLYSAGEARGSVRVCW